MKAKKITYREFSDKIGMSRSYVSSINQGVSYEVAQKIQQAYPELNIEWLMTGDGNMLKHQTENQHINENTVPLIPLAAHGGSLTGFDCEGVTRVACESILSPIEGAEMAISVTGESMSPRYPSGSKVLIKSIDHTAYIAWGETYVIDTANGVLLKVLQPGKDDSHLSCVSLNESYPPFELPISAIRKVYRVLACITVC